MRQIKPVSFSIDDVLTIAHMAGQVIMDVYREMEQLDRSRDSKSTVKKDGSPLTQADLAAHQVIVDRLNILTPDIPVVSEEDGASMVYRQPLGKFWLVDPLDGTKEFLAHNDGFTVNIALIRNGEVVLGVVLAPALDVVYWGGVGMGAYRSTGGLVEPIKVAQMPGPNQIIRVVASRSHLNTETADFIAQLKAHELLQAGSSLKFCRIAEGAADIYPRLGPTCEWDTAAAQAVVEAAGGYVTTLDGIPLRYGKPELLNPYFVAASVNFSRLQRSDD